MRILHARVFPSSFGEALGTWEITPTAALGEAQAYAERCRSAEAWTARGRKWEGVKVEVRERVLLTADVRIPVYIVEVRR